MIKSIVPFQQITIIGVGLIGGSLALAIKHRYPKIKITGVDKPSVLKRALERKAIDIAEISVERASRSAQLIIIATPISTIKKILPRIAKNCNQKTIITDTGSVKQAIVEQAQNLFTTGNFIGGHPMTGAEHSGIGAAHPLLFQNAIYILTPTKATKRKSLLTLANFFKSIDARIYIMEASIHDSVISAVSHLPQLAAVALMNSIGEHHSNAKTHLALAAGGFRDMTRIASSPFNIWKDIISENRNEIKKSLQLFIKHLKRIESIIDKDITLLASEFDLSKKLRSRIPKSMKGFLTPLVSVPIFVEDKPGELARLTTALAKHKINIKDMELLKVREGRGGTFLLSFENRIAANDAIHILKKSGFDVSGK